MQMLELATFAGIADAESINISYVSRVLRMTLLAPEIVETILAGKQPEGLTMARAMQPFPLKWRDQTFQQLLHPLCETSSLWAKLARPPSRSVQSVSRP